MDRQDDMLSDALLERGFLVEKIGTRIYLSDNAVLRPVQNRDFPGEVPSDKAFLESLLRSIDCGALEVSDRPGLPFRLTAPERKLVPEQREILFRYREIGGEAGCIPVKNAWNRFRTYPLGVKVPLAVLESHVAILTKALSAVGCNTFSACEGHAGRNGLQIDFKGTPQGAWAAYLLDDAVRAGLDLPDLRAGQRCLSALPACSGGAPAPGQEWDPRHVMRVQAQAVALGVHLYRERQRLRNERLQWIDAMHLKAPFAFPYKRLRRQALEERQRRAAG
ncbi:MAG TPA: hypothetical protein VFF81_12110 [Noviherbaspirillum sp.]|nr:hypothetical protein [Noviherbaspirillum sp.]